MEIGATYHDSSLNRRFMTFSKPYPPDLNPIDFIWKTNREEVSFRFISVNSPI
jgi:transposase